MKNNMSNDNEIDTWKAVVCDGSARLANVGKKHFLNFVRPRFN